jgi:hypothetical protein
MFGTFEMFENRRWRWPRGRRGVEQTNVIQLASEGILPDTVRSGFHDDEIPKSPDSSGGEG